MSVRRFDFDGRDVILGHIHGLGPKLVKLLDGEVVVRTVFQLDIEFEIILQARLGEIAGAGDDATLIAVAVLECHDVELGVNALGRVSANFKFTRLDPLHELADPIFNVRAVTRLLEFSQDFARHSLPDLGVGRKYKILLFFRGLNQFVSRRVGLDADENAIKGLKWITSI